MLDVKAYDNYFGGKSGSGTYQTIINNIPPHDIFYSLFLGNCGIARHIRPAAFNHLNDLDNDVFTAWYKLALPENYLLTNLPAMEVLKDIKNQLPKRRFIFLDPPYPKASRKAQIDVYRHEMSDKQHSDLLSQINAMRDQQIMIMSYPNELYDQALKGWHTKDFFSTTRNGVVLERMYMNYEPSDQLHDYQYIGEDFREREALARQKKNFIKKLKRLPAQLRNALLQELSSIA